MGDRHITIMPGGVYNENVERQIIVSDNAKIENHYEVPVAAPQTVAIPKASPSRRKTETELKPTKATFILDGDETIKNQRLTLLCRGLKANLIRNKSLIDKGTDLQKLMELFSGKPSKGFIHLKWTGSTQNLSYFMRKIVEYEYVRIPEGETIWMIVRSHIVNANGKQFNDDLHDQHDPQGKSKRVMDMLIEIMNLSKSENQILKELSEIVSA